MFWLGVVPEHIPQYLIGIEIEMHDVHKAHSKTFAHIRTQAKQKNIPIQVSAWVLYLAWINLVQETRSRITKCALGYLGEEDIEQICSIQTNHMSFGKDSAKLMMSLEELILSLQIFLYTKRPVVREKKLCCMSQGMSPLPTTEEGT